MYTRFCAFLSKASLILAVIGLISIILCVQYMVFGRKVLNDTPTWAEAFALMMVLYVTAFALAVGVRDAGHIGLESIIVLLPEKFRLKLEVVIHLLVGGFGGVMAWYCWIWTMLKWSDIKPLLGVPFGMDYLPFVISGTLIVLFSIEHIIALLKGSEVEPAWH